jgi:transcription termination/antitermination protein NusA
MGDITISGEAIRLIQAVEDHVNKWTLKELQRMEKLPEGRVRTQLHIIDCVEDGQDRLVFVVEKGHLGMALGREANHLQKLEEMFQKEVKFVEHDPDKAQFVTNLFKPFRVEKVEVEQKRGGGPLVATVMINEEDKGKAVGKKGRNVNLVRLLARRHHNIDEVKVL